VDNGEDTTTKNVVMPGLVPGIHDDGTATFKDVDGRDIGCATASLLERDKPGHDDEASPV
jgi:hypothetical protein